jgi:ATPase, YjeE family
MFKYNLSQIENISKKILLKLSNSDSLYMYGELGSGKTTLARVIIQQLQEKYKVKKTEVPSPTFNLLHEYEIKSLKVMHYDLYRLKNNQDIQKLGIFEDNENKIIIIEWPEKIKKKIKNRLEITLYYQKEVNIRKIRFKGFGKWKNFKINAI